jgi:threonine/homoserine/homoserine lactone efflux protein
MTWATYGEFLAFATVLVLIPGPDFAVVTKNTLAAHRARRLLLRRKVRRGMDGVTGAVLLGFGARLAAEHA